MVLVLSFWRDVRGQDSFCTCWFHLGTVPLLQISAPLGFCSGRVRTAAALNSLLGVRPQDPERCEEERAEGPKV